MPRHIGHHRALAPRRQIDHYVPRHHNRIELAPQVYSRKVSRQPRHRRRHAPGSRQHLHININARQMGARLLAGLEALRQRHPAVGDLRGLGLYGTLELVRNRATKEPLVAWNAPAAESQGTQEMNRRLLERGVRVAVRWNRLNVAPPLILGEAELEEGLSAIDFALDAADEFYTG